MVMTDTGYNYWTDQQNFDDTKTYALRCQWCGRVERKAKGAELNGTQRTAKYKAERVSLQGEAQRFDVV
jgi:hypothetical protein